MPRALSPATPTEEIEARQGWRGATMANGAMTAEIAEFCESGISIVLASVTRERRPVPALGLGCSVGEDGLVRVTLSRTAWLPFLDAVAAGGRIAATFTRPQTHRSIQLKAPGGSVESIGPADADTARGQSDVFARELIDVGYSASFAAGYVLAGPGDLCVVAFRPDSAFVQTPGPGAGAALV